MTLSALIKKGGLTSSMTVTVATQEADNPATVAPVASVAVAEQPQPLPELSPEEESNIRAWLAHIEESDPTIIAEVMDKHRHDPEAHRDYLNWSNEGPGGVGTNDLVTCGGCRSYHGVSTRLPVSIPTSATAPKASWKPSPDGGTRTGVIANAFYPGHS